MAAPTVWRFLRLRDVAQRTALGASTIYRLMAAGGFPPSIRVGPGTVRWLESDVDAWVRAKAEGADARPAATAKPKRETWARSVAPGRSRSEAMRARWADPVRRAALRAGQVDDPLRRAVILAEPFKARAAALAAEHGIARDLAEDVLILMEDDRLTLEAAIEEARRFASRR